MKIVAFTERYEEKPLADRIKEMMDGIKAQEILHRRNGEMSSVIVGGIAIAAKENADLARSFMLSHKIPEHIINRVLAGKYRKTDGY